MWNNLRGAGGPQKSRAAKKQPQKGALVSEPGITWTPHPVFKKPSREQCLALGADRTVALWKKREEAIDLELRDPFRYGYEPPVWSVADRQLADLRAQFPHGVVELMLFGGNRAAKSEWAAKRVMQALVEKENARWWCLQSTEASSIQNQQSLLWKYLPTEWKPAETGKLRQGAKANITYSQKGGFTENTLVLPNGSQCWFKFYSMDVGSIEGAELDGAWLDELYTPEWLEALRYRLITRNGVAIKTFTPIQGYSPAVKEELSGAKTIEDAEAELLPVLGDADAGDSDSGEAWKG